MGNRTALWLVGASGDPTFVFEANNTLPLFWCAAFRDADLAPWSAQARHVVEWDPPPDRPDALPPQEEPLELSVPWDTAQANLRSALSRAPSRMPGFETRLAAFVTALEGEAERLGATRLVLDAAEWAGFHSQPTDAADDLGAMIAVWHGDGPPRIPHSQPLHALHDVDGVGIGPLRTAQAGWPGVPLTPITPSPRDPADRAAWAWVAVISAATIGTTAATGSLLAGALAFATLFGLFLWRQPWR